MNFLEIAALALSLKMTVLSLAVDVICKSLRYRCKHLHGYPTLPWLLINRLAIVSTYMGSVNNHGSS